MNEVLTRFKQHTAQAKHNYCTNNLEQGIYINKNSYAINKQYISISELFRPYIIIDIDYSWSDYLLRETNTPEPTIQAIDRTKGTAHLFYELETPVSYQPMSRKAPQILFDGVKEELDIILNADQQFKGFISKNPLSNKWNVKTNNKKYELKEFVELSPSLKSIVDNRQKQKQKHIINAPGRNCYIFDTARKLAYSMVFKYEPTDFRKAVFEECLRANETHHMPLLPVKEIRTIAKSISDYCLKNKNKLDGKNRGILNFEEQAKRYGGEELEQAEIKERQKQGALYTAQTKANNTKQKIEQAIFELVKQGKKATQQEIATYTCLSLRTINNY
ncbi:MAG: replication initiation protein [Gallionellaceae bacterium]|nr:replication initiation protein [Gallionellaceae bacterium]